MMNDITLFDTIFKSFICFVNIDTEVVVIISRYLIKYHLMRASLPKYKIF